MASEKVVEKDGYRMTTREVVERGVRRRITDVERVKPSAASTPASEPKASGTQAPRRNSRE